MAKTRVEKLKEEVDKLHLLLNDPQFGIMTWHNFVQESWKATVELWNKG